MGIRLRTTTTGGSDCRGHDSFHHDGDFELELHSEAGAIAFDPAQFDQVVINLAVNARDAMTNGGTLRIDTGMETLDGPRAEQLKIARGRCATLSVRDNGTGIPASTLAQIFEPFFTTKELGRGTGLGLSTILGIIERHGGGIEVATAEGRGSTFRVLFPSVAPAKAAVEGVGGQPAAVPGGQTILVVEDDALMRDLMAEVLDMEGYRVLGAEHPGAALAMLESASEPIHLLLTDVVMPEMSGFSMAKVVGASHPGIQVLFMSGYADHILADQGELSGEDAFLRKPFGNDELIRKVREVLAAT